MLLQSDPVCLSFNSHDDALNYADKCVEDSVRWLAVHEFDVAHRYMQGLFQLIPYPSESTASHKWSTSGIILAAPVAQASAKNLWKVPHVLS